MYYKPSCVNLHFYFIFLNFVHFHHQKKKKKIDTQSMLWVDLLRVSQCVFCVYILCFGISPRRKHFNNERRDWYELIFASAHAVRCYDSTTAQQWNRGMTYGVYSRVYFASTMQTSAARFAFGNFLLPAAAAGGTSLHKKLDFFGSGLLGAHPAEQVWILILSTCTLTPRLSISPKTSIQLTVR